MATAKRFLDKAPNFVKRAYYSLVPFEDRYGKAYTHTLKLITSAKKWSYDQAKHYQITKLRDILIYSYKHVPYYSKLFKKIHFDPKIKQIEDINALPILTKQDIIDNHSDLISTSFHGRKYIMGTSGTTGQRLTFFGDDSLFKVEAAFIQNAYKDHGTSLYDKHSVWIRRYSPQAGDPIFFKDYELNRSYMSPFHLDDDSIHDYVKYINSTKTDTIVSYPSTIYFLSILLRKHNLKLPFVNNLHGASEVCLPQWKEIIKEVFGIPIKMHYGQVEKVSFAHQDSIDDLYKENLLYGINQYDVDNSIIGTGFYNYVMPFIRYKTNDIVELNKDVSLDNAFPKTIKNIKGRNGDMLISKSDAMLPAVNFYSFMSKYTEVDLFQIIQYKSTKKVDFYIVPNEKFTILTKSKLIEDMKYRLGDIEINIIIQDKLNRDIKSNKLKTVTLV